MNRYQILIDVEVNSNTPEDWITEAINQQLQTDEKLLSVMAKTLPAE